MQVQAIHYFSFPTPIYFGPNSHIGIPDLILERGFKRPLLVTDRSVSRLDLISKMVESLSQRGLSCSVYCDFAGNPMESHVLKGVQAFREHQADCILGIGGGSALDVSKAIALMAQHPGSLFDYEDEKLGALPVDQPIPFWIAVPTTAGTGSEVGRSTVISEERTKVKKVIFSPRLMAQAVFADPLLTVGLPPEITAATGMDALTHCIEAFLSKNFHPVCDGIALEGVRLVSKSLVQCLKAPQDLEARGSMLMASMMGAIAFQKGLGLTHSCAHALSTLLDLHHGYANALMIDHALKFNSSAASDRFARLCEIVETEDRSAEAFLEWLRNLKAELGIPSGISGYKLQDSQLHTLAKLAFQDSCHQNNPRPCKEQDFYQIYCEAQI